MTAQIIQFKCPTCGHLLGEEEFNSACRRLNKTVDDKAKEILEEEIDKINNQHKQEIRNIEEQHKLEVETKVKRQLCLQRTEIESEYIKKLMNEKTAIEEKFNQDLANKIKEIETLKSQSAIDQAQHIQQAIFDNERRHTQRETEYKLKLSRIEADNKELVSKVEQLQKTLDSIPSEMRGTAGEIILLDELHTAFPTDELEPKIVGKEMPDVVQTVVTDKGDKIAPPIVWDKKTEKDKLSKEDIEKAHNYKTKYQTDFSIIVTAKGITSKDSKNELIGKRDGIMLIHPNIAIEVAKLIRGFLIENSKLIRSKNGRESKQRKLYDYIMSAKYATKVKTIMHINSKLERLQSNEEGYHKKKWRERKKLIESWFGVEEEDEYIINEIIQD
jgi:hypothetical protein